MHHYFTLVCLLLTLTACSVPSSISHGASTRQPPADNQGGQLRLATTTSTADSGLLEAILPDFERRYNADVEVIAVGTGQALKLGENGDADVVLVHARQREDEFVAKGFGVNRRDVMYNDFIIVGPPSDPAEVRTAASAAEACSRIAAAGAIFASRGDDSGTHIKEQAIWASAAITPTASLHWYKSLGQGMGETLMAADELGAYTLTDRGTYLAMHDQLPNLQIAFGGDTIEENRDEALRNPYGVIIVNLARHGGKQNPLAAAFADWITSPDVQASIGAFGVDRFGQSLFYPLAESP
jgi:tungstate transport system substrate-binding protein